MTRLSLKMGICAQALLFLAIFLTTVLTAKAQTLSPSSISFGNVGIQTTSPAKIFVLTNTQTTALTINAISTSGDFAQTSKCPISPQTLAAGATCQILVTFTPTVLATENGSLVVDDNASTSPQTAQLTGVGVPPVTLTPTTYNFGGQMMNTSSAPHNFALYNYQAVPLTISSIVVSGNYTETSNCPGAPNTLAARSACTISVTFSPAALGTLNGTLTVTDSSSNSPQSVQLTGIGVAPVTFNPSPVTFGNQLVNTSGTPRAITFKNNQTVPLTITGISTTGDFTQTSNCPISPNTLAAGTSCTISVTFTPIALGAKTGTLTVTDNASTSPQTDSLAGTGGLPGITTIAVTPAAPSLFVGGQQQLTATANFSNGTTLNVTNLLNWSSSVPTFAQVSSTGLVQAKAPGETVIVASYSIYSGIATVKVSDPAVIGITVTPGKISQPVGAYQQFSAILHYSNGTTNDSEGAVTWSSSPPGVATINSSGLANMVSAGSTTIQASYGSVTGTGALTVTRPSCVNAPAGLTNWWTGDDNLVDIAGSSSGIPQNGGIFGSGEVAQAINFSGNGNSFLVNSPVYSPGAGTLMFWFNSTGGGALTGGYAGEQNRAPGFLIDSSGNLNWEFGNLYGQSVGHVNSNQWYHVGLTYSTANSQTTVNVYLNGALVATAVTDANTAWNPQVLFGGYVGAQQPSFVGDMDEIAVFNKTLTGPQIRAVYYAYSAGMCKPTLQSISVNPTNPNLAPGLTLPFNAAGTYSNNTTHDVTTSVVWSTSPSGFATIGASGVAAGVAAGSTTVSAALGAIQGSTTLHVKPSLVSIQVTPPNPLTPVGATQSFTATGTFSDSSQQNLTSSVTWTSSMSGVATISSNGVTTSVGPGQTTITATAGSVTGSATLNVNSATLTSIAVSPSAPTIAAGTVQQFTATGTFSDGSKQNLTNSVTWNSSSSTVATVTASGTASGIGSGQTSITATLGSVTGTASLTVTTANLTALQVNPQSSSAILGGTQQFSATAVYSNGTTVNITSSATWTSSTTTVATMSTSTLGLATSVGTGTTTITASYGGLTASTTLVVQDQLASITVTPGTAFVTIGQNAQFSATGIYISGVTENLTGSVTWSSSTPSVAGVSGGQSSGLTPGQTTITASLGNVSGTATLTVGSPSVTGQWTTLSNLMPINPIHDALLPTGEVFVVTGSGACAPNVAGCPTSGPYGPTNGGGALLMNPFTGQVTNTFTVPFDMFCNGMSLLPDGIALIAGGNLQYNPFMGLAQAATFNPTTNTFTELPNMAHGRWYPTLLTLADGTVMVFSGLNETGGTNPAVEFFNESTGSWSQQYIAPFTPDLYPRLHLLPNGLVFYSSATPKSKMFNPATFTWNSSFASTNWGGSRLYGSSVMLPLNPANGYDPKVMIFGGGNPATNTTEIIDLGAATPIWQYGPNMSQARIEMNAVILPTGNILALGGSVNNEDASTASLNADLYNPTTNTFTSAGANAFPRLYHSVAMLLPDATVWVAGGNPGQGVVEHHIEIYQPAYLFNPDGSMATRPSIASAPSSISYGNTFIVTTPDAANISQVLLIRNPTVTHAFGMDQREVIMAFTAGNGTLTVTAPPSGNIAPPGYYMLFLLNNAGVPSVATFIQMTNGGSSKSTVITMPSSAIVAQSITSNPARKQILASNVTTSDAATKTQNVRPIENPEAKIEASRKTAAQLSGTWTGTFASKHQKINPFSLTVVVGPDSHGHLTGTSTLNSDCLTSSQLQLQVSITGSKIVLAGSDESGDNITVRGTLDKNGASMQAAYILDGSATGHCETDDGIGILEKR
jgi:Galactose oxidase-like, Early set domain/Concanavalin A-like lectin/glucanases superfamily/Bacterial Ig-like domain (group 2)/Glyoxal oxidase N-terminus/Abnormal spindle-like microcephaly-assoc'd, ASPM-SPD-2-Hydin/HYDIN/CFA65/VesB-like, Ig-like domain